MQNYYEMLGVSQDVTPSIAKIAYEGKLKVLGRAEMGEEQRKAEERELTQAFVTLSVPAKKVWYDKQLALQGEREDRAVRSSNRTAWTVAGVVCAFLVAGAGWAYVNRVNERERVRLEEQRIAIEKEKASKAAEIEEARLQLQQDSQDYNQQMDTRRQVAREQAYKDQQSRMAQDRAFQQQVQGRVINSFDERNAQ